MSGEILCACGLYNFNPKRKLPELKTRLPESSHPLIRQFFTIKNTANLSQAKLAAQIGIGHTTIDQWRVGRSPTLFTFQSALNALGYDLTITKKPSP